MSGATDRHGPLHVLIIDDEPEIGDLVAAAAESLGLAARSLVSAQGFEAALGRGLAAVFVDLMMPDIDGIELVRKLAERRCAAPIVMMSGHDRSVLRSAEAVAQSLGLRTAGALHKPFRIAEVEALLLSLVGTVQDQPARQRDAAAPLEDSEVRAAIAGGAVVVHYQPQISLASGGLVGVEALVRLHAPGCDLVFPDRFLPSVERQGLMDALTGQVMQQALRAARQVPGMVDATVSINVAAESLLDLELPDRLARCAADLGLPLNRVVVEITESGLIREFGTALDVLARLRLRGVGISIDDFGTGYSSMAQLRRIPCTELKIDRTFVQDMLGDDAARIVVEQSVDLAHRLHLKVVAEGVETPAQAGVLRDMGCELGQGYLYSKPLPAADLAQWIAAQGAVPAGASLSAAG